MIISAWPWCIFPFTLVQIFISSPELLTFFSKFKVAAAAILDFQFMWIWPFRRIGSVVFVFCAKFGSNICYSHWDRRTYDSDIHLMMSRELTSGFHFGHFVIFAWPWCIFPWNLVQISSQSGVIDIFSKIKDGGRHHLGFVWVSRVTIHEASFVVRTSCKKFVMIG